MKLSNFLVLIVFIFLGHTSQVYAEGQVLDRVVAVVNDDAITQSELDSYLRPLYLQMKTEYKGQDDLINRQINDARGKLLNQMIEDRLVYQKAKEMKIEVAETELDQEMASFKRRFKSDAEFEANMRQEGFSLRSVKDKLSRQIMIRRLHDREVRSHVIVSPMEVEAYYKEHAADFVQKTRVKTRSITVKKSEQAREKGLTDEDSKKRIDEIRQKVIAHPEQFPELAMKNSEDYQALKGGLGDWMEPGSMIPAIEEVIFSLKKGEVSPVIETPMGYHIFRIEDHQDGLTKKFEDVHGQIYDHIYREKAKKRFDEWMEELKREAYISLRS